MIRGAGLLAMVAACACAASASDVKRAHEARYQTDFPVVWAAVEDAIHERYEPRIVQIDDPAKGILITQWKLVIATQEDSQGMSRSGSAQTGGASVAQGTLMRMKVKVRGVNGGPPWEVLVDGEAAEYRHDLTMLVPYKHGAIDEPEFVPGRIQALEMNIYNRLLKYAVPATGVPGANGPATQATDLPASSQPAAGAPASAPASHP